MKLLMGALALTLSLSFIACSGSKGGGKGNTNGYDGNYVSFTPKSQSSSYLMEVVEIKDGTMNTVYVDLDTGKYVTYTMSVNINGSKSSVKLTSISCKNFGNPGTLNDDIEKADGGVIISSEDGGADFYQPITKEQKSKLLSVIQNQKVHSGSCDDFPGSGSNSASPELTRELMASVLKKAGYNEAADQELKEQNDQVSVDGQYNPEQEDDSWSDEEQSVDDSGTWTDEE